MGYRRFVTSTVSRTILCGALLALSACSISPAGSAPYISAPNGGYGVDAGDLNSLSTGTPIW